MSRAASACLLLPQSAKKEKGCKHEAEGVCLIFMWTTGLPFLFMENDNALEPGAGLTALSQKLLLLSF